jgi:GH15 family glucan-1,4-alpha-glucosidase
LEELGADGRHLGNFPQAFTHLALEALQLIWIGPFQA